MVSPLWANLCIETVEEPGMDYLSARVQGSEKELNVTESL